MIRNKVTSSRVMTMNQIEAYCDYLYDCEKSKETIRKYYQYLVRFLETTEGSSICKRQVLLWKEMIRRQMAPGTVNGALTALNGFFKYCGWTDCETRLLKIGRNPFCAESRELSKEEYRRLVKAAYEKGNERLGVLLQTICSSGIRISELSFITMEAVNKGQAEVECKGKIRTVLLTKKLCALLKEYAGRKNISKGSIFVTRNGKALDRSNTWREMKSLCDCSGVCREKVFPHNLRHLFARTYYGREKDLSKLADILGHSDINTTRIYTVESGSKHRKQLEKLDLIFGTYNRLSILL